ncbi:MAG: hypothetical protein WCI88_07035 [Chloroflexota bacterium]
MKTIQFNKTEMQEFLKLNGKSFFVSRAVVPQPELGMDWKGLYQIADDQIDLPDCLCPFEIGSDLLIREQVKIIGANIDKTDPTIWQVHLQYTADSTETWQECPKRLTRQYPSGPPIGATLTCFVEACRYKLHVSGVGLDHNKNANRWEWLLCLEQP